MQMQHCALPGYAATALVRTVGSGSELPRKREIEITMRFAGGPGRNVKATGRVKNVLLSKMSARHSLAARGLSHTPLLGAGLRARGSGTHMPVQAVAVPMRPMDTPSPAKQTIPGDHMANAKAGLPDGVNSMVVDRFTLDSGVEMRDVLVAYSTYGTLNDAADNGVIVGHSLTSNSNVHEWWPQMLGSNDPTSSKDESGFCLDTAEDFVICCNFCGSPYGSASPVTVSPERSDAGCYGADFPVFTIRDHVRLQKKVLDRLGVKQLRLAIGGSMGGMIALEWGATYPEYVGQMILIASCGRHSDWAIGLGQVQRAAITSDQSFHDGRYAELGSKPERGLANARMMAMLTYRAPSSVDEKFGRSFTELSCGSSIYAVESYLRYQGEKFIGRFDANCYLGLTASLDTHNVAAGRGDYREVLQSISHKTLIVGIDSDMLYPIELQMELAQHLPNASMHTIKSPHGHDSFLIEIDSLNETILRFRRGLNPSSAAAAAEELAASCASPEERDRVLKVALGDALQTSEQSVKEILRLNLKLQAMEAKLRATNIPKEELCELCTPSLENLREMDRRVVERIRQKKTPW
eukprot:CAMPEP_0198199644 /NCGR_PEP_ID=MMETSP1445-20131203/2873_1 /TAXON_ID=36898 /ORGANISM="Pyramimonas sp., Strain CCMP2087" /LENGTH=579 /DNA_ID=CAMNT_0043869529 /DNA_START=260 /DNA_END=1996 /DNA_ORIENTATION=+